MKLSLRGEYALRALITLGESHSDKVVPIRLISARQRIPKRFLEQILNDLKSGGFVESKRGIAGGYRLARPPEQLVLATVIRHVGGAVEPVGRSGGSTARLATQADAAQSAIRSVMREASEAMMKVLDGMTIADLCERARQMRARHAAVPDYAI